MGKHRQFKNKGNSDFYVGGEYVYKHNRVPMDYVNGYRLTKKWLKEDYTKKIEGTYGLKLKFFPRKESADVEKEGLELLARHFISYCWGCGVGRSKHKPFEKAHVLPRSKCKVEKYYDKEHNKVLLCKQCHKDSPDTTNIEYFYQWISQKEPYFESLSKGVFKAIKGRYSLAEIQKFFDHDNSKLDPRELRKQVEKIGFDSEDGALRLTKHHGYNHASRVSFIFDLFNRIHNPNYNHDWHYEGNRVD